MRCVFYNLQLHHKRSFTKRKWPLCCDNTDGLILKHKTSTTA